MAKTSEGKETRRAFDGPDIDADKLLAKIGRWNREDRERASSAGETRSDIGQYLEDTGLHPKALSMLRTIKKVEAKDNGQAKAMDLIRSLKAGLKIVEQDISGNSTRDMFGDDDDAPPVEPLAEGEGVPTEAEIAATFGDGDDDSGPFDDDLDDAGDFNAAVDSATVVPFTGAAVG